MSGEALKLKLAIANLQKQHGLSVPPFMPLPLGPTIDYDITRQGYCSPATIDREFTKFAPTCWQSFKQDIPILYRHDPDRPAGRLEEIRVDAKGLFARVRLSHALAKQCPYFSVCATVHDWRIVQAGAQSYGLVTSATLDEVSLVPDNPGNAEAFAGVRPQLQRSGGAQWWCCRAVSSWASCSSTRRAKTSLGSPRVPAAAMSH